MTSFLKDEVPEENKAVEVPADTARLLAFAWSVISLQKLEIEALKKENFFLKNPDEREVKKPWLK